MTFSSPSAEAGALPAQAAHAWYWRRKRNLTLRLLTVWLFSTFLVIYFARDLDHLKLFGWPLSYYMAAQGLALVYLALLVIYNRRVSKMETQMKIQIKMQMETQLQDKQDNLEAESRHAG